MAVKIIGAFCVLGVCSGYGYYLAWQQQLEKSLIIQLIHLLDFMECELAYRLTPLPLLCEKCAQEATGVLRDVITKFAQELSSQIQPDPVHCMETVLAKRRDIPPQSNKVLVQLSAQLGRFDLGGQVQCLHSVRDTCNRILSSLYDDTQMSGKRYKTLGLCVGAALVIIFI